MIVTRLIEIKSVFGKSDQQMAGEMERTSIPK